LCKGKYKIEIESDQPVDVYLGRDCHGILSTHHQITCTVEYAASLMVINAPGEVYYNVTVQRDDPPLNKDMNWDKNTFRYPDIYPDIFN